MNGKGSRIDRTRRRDRRCDRCGGRMRKRGATVRKPYRYTASGLGNINLAGIPVYGCPRCGTESPVIPQIGQLHEAIARDLLEQSAPLTGQEIRFLRKNAGISARELAALIGIDPAHLSRVENGHREALGPAADKLTRAVVTAKVGLPDELGEILLHVARKIDEEDAGGVAEHVFRLRNDGWRAA